jgi:hypothetical protein
MKELIEKMQNLDIKSIALDRGLGTVFIDKNGNLSYESGLHYYVHPRYAFEDALKKLDIYENKLLNWKKIVPIKFSTSLIYHNDDNNERKESLQKWCWKSDITDSGISVKEDFLIEGNINQLRKFYSYANNHMRYCNGCYYRYENEEVKEWMDIFRTFGLYEAYDSFEEYYHNSIVD